MLDRVYEGVHDDQWGQNVLSMDMACHVIKYGRGLFSLDGKYSVSELGNHNKCMNTKYQLSPLFCSTMLFPKDASIFIWWSAKGIDQGTSQKCFFFSDFDI